MAVKPPRASPRKAAAARRNGRKGAPHGKKGGRPRAPRWDYAVTEAPDTLDTIRKAVALLDRVMDEIIADQRMAPERKRQELRATAKALGPLVPKARLREAEEAVRGERDEMEQVTKDPPLEARPGAVVASG